MASLADSELVRILLAEEIDRIVADAASSAEMVDVGRCVERLGNAFPNSGMSEDEITNRLAMAAVSAGLAVELNRRSATS